VYALSNYLKVFAELFLKNDLPEAAFLLKVSAIYWNNKYSTLNWDRAIYFDVTF